MLENGVWRTVGGRRIFIKDGQDLISAMKESGKFPNKIEERKNDNVLTVKDIPKLTVEEAKEYIKSEEFKQNIKDFIKNEYDDNLTSCKEVSNLVTKFLNDNEIEAETISVTPFVKGRMETSGGHFVTKIDNELYDFTGKQYLNEINSEGVELRIYKNIGDDFYSRKEINFNNNMSIDEKTIKIIEYTENNQDELIFRIYK